MTVNGKTLCSLIQSFPVLLILAQNANKCLKTPFVYKPPTPTHPPEYYEAYDALIQSLLHGCKQHQYLPSYGYSKKSDEYSYGSPCYSGPAISHYPSYPQSYPQSYPSHNYDFTPQYVYRSLNSLNTSSNPEYNYANYANHVTNVKRKYKVVIVKPRRGHRSQKLQVEPCTTVDDGSGSCISLFQCAPYLKMLQQSQKNPAVLQVLRKAQCGFDGSNPKVCCPRPGIPTSLPTDTAATEALVPTTEPPRPLAKSLNDDDFIDSFPEPPQCGESKASFTRVVGGVDARLGDFPWVALLGYRRRNQETHWLCGGSLVSSKHVLTAAHCIHGHEDDLYLVRLGELDLARDDEGTAPVDVLIKSKIKHEGYNSKAFTNDIGILVLQKEITFTALIRPICIPVDTELRARSFVDYNPIIAGWGHTEFRGPAATHLQALQLPVVSNEQCAEAYVQYKAQTIDERVLCAGYKNGGKDACQGDSGGPLMQPIWNSKKFTTQFYQIGVVSYGKGCAETGFPGVYTRVTHFVPWLQEKMLGKV